LSPLIVRVDEGDVDTNPLGPTDAGDRVGTAASGAKRL
jgi:hypothetical protein